MALICAEYRLLKNGYVNKGTIMNKDVDLILVKQFGIEESALSSNMNLVDDLNADSLDVVEIAFRIEKRFKIKIEEEEVETAVTVQLLRDLVSRKLEEKAQRVEVA